MHFRCEEISSKVSKGHRNKMDSIYVYASAVHPGAGYPGEGDGDCILERVGEAPKDFLSGLVGDLHGKAVHMTWGDPAPMPR